MVARIFGCIVFCSALLSAAMPASAQAPGCTLYKVNTSLLNISQVAGGDLYKDALFDGDIVCVTQQQPVGDQPWAYISHKLESANGRTPVDGWSPLKYLAPTSKDEAEAVLGTIESAVAAAPTAPAAPAAPPAAGTPATPAPPAPPPAAVANAGAMAPMRPEEILRFDQPIPFGPYPLNGHSLQEMINSIPLFSPVEGLDESLWKKQCTTCHQWDKARLCEQGATYVKAPKNVLRVPHPFGGALKIAMMRWTKSGCE